MWGMSLMGAEGGGDSPDIRREHSLIIKRMSWGCLVKPLSLYTPVLNNAVRNRSAHEIEWERYLQVRPPPKVDPLKLYYLKRGGWHHASRRAITTIRSASEV